MPIACCALSTNIQNLKTIHNDQLYNQQFGVKKIQIADNNLIIRNQNEVFTSYSKNATKR